MHSPASKMIRFIVKCFFYPLGRYFWKHILSLSLDDEGKSKKSTCGFVVPQNKKEYIRKMCLVDWKCVFTQDDIDAVKKWFSLLWYLL